MPVRSRERKRLANCWWLIWEKHEPGWLLDILENNDLWTPLRIGIGPGFSDLLEVPSSVPDMPTTDEF